MDVVESKKSALKTIHFHYVPPLPPGKYHRACNERVGWQVCSRWEEAAPKVQEKSLNLIFFVTFLMNELPLIFPVAPKSISFNFLLHLANHQMMTATATSRLPFHFQSVPVSRLFFPFFFSIIFTNITHISRGGRKICGLPFICLKSNPPKPCPKIVEEEEIYRTNNPNKEYQRPHRSLVDID